MSVDKLLGSLQIIKHFKTANPILDYLAQHIAQYRKV